MSRSTPTLALLLIVLLSGCAAPAQLHSEASLIPPQNNPPPAPVVVGAYLLNNTTARGAPTFVVLNVLPPAAAARHLQVVVSVGDVPHSLKVTVPAGATEATASFREFRTGTFEVALSEPGHARGLGSLDVLPSTINASLGTRENILSASVSLILHLKNTAPLMGAAGWVIQVDGKNFTDGIAHLAPGEERNLTLELPPLDRSVDHVVTAIVNDAREPLQVTLLPRAILAPLWERGAGNWNGTCFDRSYARLAVRNHGAALSDAVVTFHEEKDVESILKKALDLEYPALLRSDLNASRDTRLSFHLDHGFGTTTEWTLGDLAVDARTRTSTVTLRGLRDECGPGDPHTVIAIARAGPERDLVGAWPLPMEI